jgi:hypothetical protein
VPTAPILERPAPDTATAVRPFVLFALCLAVALLLAVALNAGPRLRGAPDTVALTGATMAVQLGTGHVAGSALLLDGPGNGGVTLVANTTRSIAAAEYSRATWRLGAALPPGTELSMTWRVRERPGRVYSAPLDGSSARPAANLAAHPDWTGTVHAIGLGMRGSFPAPLAIEGVDLRSNAWTVTLADILRQWLGTDLARTGVSTRLGFEEAHIAPMLVVVAGAIAFAVAFLVLRARRRGTSLPVVAIALVAVAGWLVLDLRWQALLGFKHAAVIAAGFDRSTDERNAAMDDGALFEVARRIRDADRARGGRVLVLSDNTSLATRVGWFLYPDNVYYDSRPLGRQRIPPPDALRPGDQVVLLLYGKLRWDPARGVLAWPDGRTREARAILADGPSFALVEVK